MVNLGNPAGFWERCALRLIGLGVVLLTDKPFSNMMIYFGKFWNVGAWAIANAPITKKA
jgi:hypothetical protein